VAVLLGPPPSPPLLLRLLLHVWLLGCQLWLLHYRLVVLGCSCRRRQLRLLQLQLGRHQSRQQLRLPLLLWC
jgi:hypothetical protein